MQVITARVYFWALCMISFCLNVSYPYVSFIFLIYLLTWAVNPWHCYVLIVSAPPFSLYHMHIHHLHIVLQKSTRSPASREPQPTSKAWVREVCGHAASSLQGVNCLKTLCFLCLYYQFARRSLLENAVLAVFALSGQSWELGTKTCRACLERLESPLVIRISVCVDATIMHTKVRVLNCIQLELGSQPLNSGARCTHMSSPISLSLGNCATHCPTLDLTHHAPSTYGLPCSVSLSWKWNAILTSTISCSPHSVWQSVRQKWDGCVLLA